MLSKEQIDRIDELGLAAANDIRAGVAFVNAAHHAGDVLRGPK